MLITFEGIDGSGKSTQARRLVAHLQDAGRDPVFVRDPGGVPLAEAVRTLVLDAEADVAPFAELMLFAAARAQLVAERIRPALDAGRVVVADRFYDSTTAYQGAGRGLAETDWLRDLHRRVTGGLVPHRTYLVEVPVAEALRRRHGPPDRMEAADAAFFARVADGYAALAARAPRRFRRLDGTRPADALHADVRADCEALLRAASPSMHDAGAEGRGTAPQRPGSSGTSAG
jgi:dTMP kinase